VGIDGYGPYELPPPLVGFATFDPAGLLFPHTMAFSSPGHASNANE
jgi:hypothetical protein